MSVVAAMVRDLDLGHILIGPCWFLLGIYDLIHIADQLLVLTLSYCFLLLLLDFAFRNVVGEHSLDEQVSMVWEGRSLGCLTLQRVSC